MATKKTVSGKDKKLIARINRVSGQLKAISRMIEEGKEKDKIAVQISAAQSGINGVKEQFTKMLLMEEVLQKVRGVVNDIK